MDYKLKYLKYKKKYNKAKQRAELSIMMKTQHLQ